MSKRRQQAEDKRRRQQQEEEKNKRQGGDSRKTQSATQNDSHRSRKQPNLILFGVFFAVLALVIILVYMLGPGGQKGPAQLGNVNSNNQQLASGTPAQSDKKNPNEAPPTIERPKLPDNWQTLKLTLNSRTATIDDVVVSLEAIGTKEKTVQGTKRILLCADFTAQASGSERNNYKQVAAREGFIYPTSKRRWFINVDEISNDFVTIKVGSVENPPK